jgi:hypothetical protein
MNSLKASKFASQFVSGKRWRRCAAALALPVAAALAWLAAPPAHAQGASILTPFSSAAGPKPPEPWHFTTLPNKKPTTFEVTELDGQKVLKAVADSSYGNLVHNVRVPLNTGTTLGWRWRVEEFVAGADLRVKEGDDGAAKVCVFFDYPVDRLTLGERTKLALARSATGESVPAEALCYVWDNKEMKGSEFDNAFTKRERMEVLESGATKAAGGWLSEKRNLLTDYKKAFGAEAGELVPDVIGIAIQADADNTKAHGVAYFSDVDLRSAPAATAAVAGSKE